VYQSSGNYFKIERIDRKKEKSEESKGSGGEEVNVQE
jgi:hypothetical protein